MSGSQIQGYQLLSWPFVILRANKYNVQVCTHLNSLKPQIAQIKIRKKLRTVKDHLTSLAA